MTYAHQTQEVVDVTQQPSPWFRLVMTLPMDTKADLVIVGGRVISMHPGATGEAHGVAIKGKRIVGLIRREQLRAVSHESTQVIDVGDRPLLPGFVDVHAHGEVVCRTSFGTVDCRTPGCHSINDVRDRLADAVAKQAAGQWVVGQGNLFYDRKLKERRLPSRAELDQVSRSSPIAIRAGGHITVLNSKALEVSGIDRHYVPPKYSVTGLPEVQRDSAGEPTGVVKEMDNLLPFPGYDRGNLRAALKSGVRDYFSRFGVTTIGEISETVDGIESLDEMASAGQLDASVRVYLWAPGTLKLADACRWRKHVSLQAGEDQVRIQGVKIFADGGFSARSAAVNCPYVGEGSRCGDIAFPRYFFRRAFEQTQKHNLQLAVHANGDRAQEWLCQLLVEMGGAGTGRTRMRIEHAGNFLPEERTRQWWAAAGIIPVPQPVFLYTFGEYFPDYLGETGRRGRFPFRSLMREGWRLSGSSDVWVGSELEATNPLFGVWCCVKRQTYSGNFIDEHESLSVGDALRLHTYDAAAVLGEDDVRGSLAPGKLADVIVLERDPEKIPVDALRELKVDYTFHLGRLVYDRLRPGIEVPS